MITMSANSINLNQLDFLKNLRFPLPFCKGTYVSRIFLLIKSSLSRECLIIRGTVTWPSEVTVVIMYYTYLLRGCTSEDFVEFLIVCLTPGIREFCYHFPTGLQHSMKYVIITTNF